LFSLQQQYGQYVIYYIQINILPCFKHRLIEIDGTFAFSFIISVREVELFRGQPIRAFVQFYYFLNDKIIICHDSNDDIIYILKYNVLSFSS